MQFQSYCGQRLWQRKLWFLSFPTSAWPSEQHCIQLFIFEIEWKCIYYIARYAYVYLVLLISCRYLDFQLCAYCSQNNSVICRFGASPLRPRGELMSDHVTFKSRHAQVLPLANVSLDESQCSAGAWHPDQDPGLGHSGIYQPFKALIEGLCIKGSLAVAFIRDRSLRGLSKELKSLMPWPAAAFS